MSDTNKETSNSLPAPYRVGYKHPPAEHRFRKGQSGNPHGRRKGSQNKPKIDTSFGSRATEEMLKSEAYRTITVREGEDLVKLPVIQAVFRALGVSAMKGNRLAQKTFAELMQNVEQADYQSRLEYFETFFNYKHEWSEAIERARKQGAPLPEPVPHPDDISLDFNTGSVSFNGPITKEAKERFDQALQVRTEAQEEVSYWAKRNRSARKDEVRQRCLEMWHMDQKLFDTINEALPERYQTELQDRSYAKGATRKGEFAKRYSKEKR